MTHKSSIRNSATLRHRLEVGSSFALRAVAHSAGSVQSVAVHCAATRASDISQTTEPMIASITAGGKAMQQAPCSFAPKLLFPFRLSTKPQSRLAPFAFVLHRKTRPAVKGNGQQSLLSAPNKVSISVTVGTSQCLLGVLANPSLNRTHCGVPSFGLKILAQMPAHRNGPVS